MNTDGNLDALNRHLAERDAHDERREAEQELQDLRDEVDALVAKLAEADERIAWLDCGLEGAMADREAAETALATARRDALVGAADMIQVGIKRRQPALTRLAQKLSASKMPDLKYRVIRAEVDAMQSCRDKILALTTEGKSNE